MRLYKHIKTAAVFIFWSLALLAAPARAAVVVNWSDYVATSFFAQGTSWAIGKDHANAACGSFSSGDIILLVNTAWTNGGGDPGAMSVPTGFTLIWSTTQADMRTAVWYKVSDGTESCSTGFTTSWSTTSVRRSWAIVDITGSSGLDASSSQGGNRSDTSLIAPSCSPTNSTDGLVGIFTTGTMGGPYTKPSDMSLVLDIGSGGSPSEILVGFKTLSSSGATGTETATNATTFDNYVAGLVALSAGGASPKPQLLTLMGVGS